MGCDRRTSVLSLRSSKYVPLLTLHLNNFWIAFITVYESSVPATNLSHTRPVVSSPLPVKYLSDSFISICISPISLAACWIFPRLKLKWNICFCVCTLRRIYQVYIIYLSENHSQSMIAKLLEATAICTRQIYFKFL